MPEIYLYKIISVILKNSYLKCQDNSLDQPCVFLQLMFKKRNVLNPKLEKIEEKERTSNAVDFVIR